MAFGLEETVPTSSVADLVYDLLPLSWRPGVDVAAQVDHWQRSIIG